MEEQYLNRFSEPTFRIREQCRGCSGLTRLKKIYLDCDRCGGTGEEEDRWEPWHEKYITCWDCSGSGEIWLWMRYCCQECFEASNYEDWN